MDFTMNEGKTDASLQVVPEQIAGIPISSVKDALNALRGWIQQSDEPFKCSIPQELEEVAEKTLDDPENLKRLQGFLSEFMDRGPRSVKSSQITIATLLRPENLEATFTLLSAGKPVDLLTTKIETFFRWIVDTQAWKNIP